MHFRPCGGANEAVEKELLDIVVSHLTNREIKSLRAAGRSVERLVALRITRLFLSANSRNINVFRAVADHETLRHGVTEIVWDDARLRTSKCARLDGDHAPEPLKNRYAIVAGDDCPSWFRDADDISMWCCPPRESAEEGAETVASILDGWRYYKALIQDQQTVLDTSADVDALKYGLARLPSLKRVTLTPTAHRSRNGKPLYYTPMIRSFPEKFGYPLPHAWPGTMRKDIPGDVYSWHVNEHQDECTRDCTIEDYRNRWRGFRKILRTLAENDHHITEFVVETFDHRTGINCNIFSEPSQECDGFAALLASPGFRHLSLALFTGVTEHEAWPCFRSGLLQQALAGAQQLEHLYLSCSMDIGENGFAGQVELEVEEDKESFFVPLHSIFPVRSWPNLQYFGINRLLVRGRGLVDFLEALPASLRAVKLSHLAFEGGESSYRSLLQAMRDKLDWRSRPAAQRPNVENVVKNDCGGERGHYISVDAATGRFLYSDSEDADSLNPFNNPDFPNDPAEGMGVVERKYIDPLVEIPFRREYPSDFFYVDDDDVDDDE